LFATKHVTFSYRKAVSEKGRKGVQYSKRYDQGEVFQRFFFKTGN